MNHLVTRLELALRDEERLYQSFLKLMQQEIDAVEKFTPVKIEKLTQKREEFLLSIAAAADGRITIQNEILQNMGVEPGENTKLSELVLLLPDGRRKEELRERVSEFKVLVEEVYRVAHQLNRLVGWSMSIVNGSLSIMRSCAVDEVKGYSRSGSQNSTYHPRFGRATLNIKEA